MEIKNYLWYEMHDDYLESHWKGFMGVGFIIGALGVLAALFALIPPLSSLRILGMMLLVGGVIQGVHAFEHHSRKRFSVDILTSVLYVTAGLIAAARPEVSAGAFALVLAFTLLCGGLFRLIIPSAEQFPLWTPVALHGALRLLLGGILFLSYPITTAWVIGLFIGLDMLATGSTLTLLGYTACRAYQTHNMNEPVPHS